jgi:hypothetical protein
MSLANAIIEEDLHAVEEWLRRRIDPNEMDEYGFTPLIEAAIADNIDITKRLLAYGADVNGQDATGNTALHWAAENNNLELARLLLEHRANPNAYTLAGQPVLVMPILRRQTDLKKLLYKHGASEIFAQDFINVKLLGHMFELVGTASILDPQKKLVEVDFEGFFLEITLGLICDSLAQFQNNYGARKLRRYLGLSQVIVEVMQRAADLVRYRQYRVDVKKHQKTIHFLLEQEPLIIAIGYEGHAITFVKYGHIIAKCDRREDSRLFDNIMCYRIGRPDLFTTEFLMQLMYAKHSGRFINEELPRLLALEPLTELKVESQISGNCSWANVEACIPTLFFLILASLPGGSDSLAHYKSLALNFYHRWHEWNKERALQFCLQSFEEANSIRKASKAEILAAILFQRCGSGQLSDKTRIETILPVFHNSRYQYILQNYLQTYYYRRPTPEGEQFAKMLKEHGIIKS